MSVQVDRKVMTTVGVGSKGKHIVGVGLEGETDLVELHVGGRAVEG